MATNMKNPATGAGPVVAGLAGAGPPPPNISQLNIMLIISDPAKIETPVLLTSDMLDPLNQTQKTQSKKLSKTPFFSDNIKYSSSELNKLTYSKRVQTFFNRSSFLKFLTQYGTPSTTTSEIREHNISTMIHVLFPTVFPIINNYSDSFTRFIQQNVEFNLSIKGAIPFPLNIVLPNLELNYTYIKIDNTVYTITETVWLNDFLNHPIYRKLLFEFTSFNGWRKDQSKGITQLIETLTKKITKGLDAYTGKIDLDIAEITKLKLTENTINADLINKPVESLINILNKIKQPSEDKVNVFIENAEDIRNIIKQLSTKINLPSKFIKNTKILLEDAIRINILQIIKQKYFGDEINLNFEDDDADVKTTFKERFQKYLTFIDIIIGYIKPKRETTNTDLQTQIDNYTQGIDMDLQKTLDKINNIKSNAQIDGNFEKLLDVELCKIEPAKDESNSSFNTTVVYEIYLQMDVIKGELNNTNIKDIKCRYNDEKLGDIFQNEIIYSKNLNKYEINKKRLFFDIEKQGNKSIQKEQETEIKKVEMDNKKVQENQLLPKPPIEPKKQVKFNGGKTKKSKRRRYNKTRKHRRFTQLKM